MNNCELTYNSEDVKTADAVVVLLHRIKNVKDLPFKERKKDQIWIFLSDESPKHTFMNSKGNHWTHYFNVFNWSMTYRFVYIPVHILNISDC